MELIREYGARRLGLRVAVAGLILGTLLLLLHGHAGDLSVQRVFGAFALIDWHDWVGAVVATAISFWAIGRFDVVIHRHLDTGIVPERAARAGQAGVAFGQCLGLTFLTGAILRLRCLPELGVRRTLRLSMLASAAFMIAHLILCGLVATVLWPSAAWITWTTAVCVLGLAAIAFFMPTFCVGRFRVSMPTLSACWSMLVYAALDTLAAAVALYFLLPEGLPFERIYAAYLFALFGGLITGIPGAAGALEVGFIALISAPDVAPVLSGLIAFRLVYFALPAVCAAGFALRRDTSPTPQEDPEVFTSAPARAEQWLLAHVESQTLHVEGNWGGAIATPHSLSLYLGPLKGQLSPLLKPLHRAARARNRVALLYRVSQAHAQEVRRMGWRAMAIAEEALIETNTYCTDGPARRQLRRALRKAEMAGLVIAEVTGIPPFDALDRINKEWVASHGTERGVTMGRYSRDAILGQRLFIARAENRIIAFATFHHLRNEWCLDLMRHSDNPPAGTMHALLHAAVTTAKSEDVPVVSFATVPLGPRFLTRKSDGLRRFKTSFDPSWRIRFLCAPNVIALAVGGVDLLRAVHRPPEYANEAHVRHENNEFASHRNLWDTRTERESSKHSQAGHGKSAQKTARVA